MKAEILHVEAGWQVSQPPCYNGLNKERMIHSNDVSFGEERSNVFVFM